MITEKDTIKCEAVFSEDRAHRFLWKRTWSKEKPMATVIMLNACSSDTLIMDFTTSLVVNNVTRLEHYGSVCICNIFSRLTPKLSFRWNSDDDLNMSENDTYIKKAAEESSCVILAWGKAAGTNIRVTNRARQVIELLEPCKDKLFCISDGEKKGLHPLTPSLRNQWILERFDWTEAISDTARESEGEDKQ